VQMETFCCACAGELQHVAAAPAAASGGLQQGLAVPMEALCCACAGELQGAAAAAAAASGGLQQCLAAQEPVQGVVELVNPAAATAPAAEGGMVRPR
jgi:hypothetical protein